MKRTKMLAILFLGLSCSISFAQTSSNLLADSSFEEWSWDSTSTNWSTFGSASCVAETPRTKKFAVKMFGNFTGQTNSSGIFQDVPATAGKSYEGTAYMRQNPKDDLKGENKAWLKLEFYDADGKQISVAHSLMKLDAKAPSNKYVFITTGPVQAPPATAKARFVAIFSQGPDKARGAVFVDDVSLREVP